MLFQDGVITAKIETPDETYHVEPSWRHLGDNDTRSMIAYKESDVLYSWNQPDMDSFVPPKVCDYIKENGTAVGYEDGDEEDEYDEHGHRIVKDEFDEHGHRIKRQATGK